MKELIENWLSGRRSYTYGAILYNKFGSDEKLKDLFSRPKTDYSQELMVEKLKEIISDASTKPAAQDFSYEKMPDAADPVLKAMKDEWMPAFTEMNYLRHQLDKWLEDDSKEAQAKRGELALQILTLEKQCMAVWAKRDHYLKHGTLPGKDVGDEEIVIDKFKAGQHLQNLKVYIRRYKGYLKKDPGNAQHALLLKKYEDELDQLKKLHGNGQ